MQFLIIIPVVLQSFTWRFFLFSGAIVAQAAFFEYSVERSNDRLIDWLIDPFIHSSIDWLFDLSIVRSIDWLIGWLIYWFIEWHFVFFFPFVCVLAWKWIIFWYFVYSKIWQVEFFVVLVRQPVVFLWNFAVVRKATVNLLLFAGSQTSSQSMSFVHFYSRSWWSGKHTHVREGIPSHGQSRRFRHWRLIKRRKPLGGQGLFPADHKGTRLRRTCRGHGKQTGNCFFPYFTECMQLLSMFWACGRFFLFWKIFFISEDFSPFPLWIFPLLLLIFLLIHGKIFHNSISEL